MIPAASARAVEIVVEGQVLHGDVRGPEGAAGIVLFAHGSGSGRHSPRNRHVAERLNEAGLATLLMDLLTEEEERIDARTGRLRFDIGLLADRLSGATEWLRADPELGALPCGYFGASTGAAAALLASLHHPNGVRAIVSRGGRPDLAGPGLGRVTAPTLLLVGSLDAPVIGMNEEAMAQMRCEKRLVIVEEASHLFEEPGKLNEVSRLAGDWFLGHLVQGTTQGP